MSADRSIRFDTSMPASRRISRPSAWNVRTRTGPRRDPERRDRGVQSLRELLGRALVERDRRDGRGIRALVDEPGDARDERRGLARARRRDAEHRSGRRGGGGSLVRRQPREPGDDLGMGHGRAVWRRPLTRHSSPESVARTHRNHGARAPRDDGTLTKQGGPVRSGAVAFGACHRPCPPPTPLP